MHILRRIVRISLLVGKAIARVFVVVMHVGSGLMGGHSTDESARALYEKRTEYRP